MESIDVLLSLKHDVFERDPIIEFLDVVEKSQEPCKFRYDCSSGMIYEDVDISDRKYTYIAKANKGDIYKIGHTDNLKRRIKSLALDKPYSFLGLKPIAFCPRDCENVILVFTQAKYRPLPKPFDNARELLILSDDDIDFIIETFGFFKIEGDEYPEEMMKIARRFYDPVDGHYINTEMIFNNKQ